MRLLSLLFFACLLLSCSDSSELALESSGRFLPEPSGYELANAVGNSSLGLLNNAYTEDYSFLQSPPPPQDGSDKKIIKSANPAFESDKLDAEHSRITGLVDQYEGYVQKDESGGSGNRSFRNLNLRVPSENFDAFIEVVSEGVGFFDTRDINRRDVTEDFVDVEARLKTKKELERRYLEILSEAKKVSEMLEIERELADVRGEVEAAEGRLQYLSDQVTYSSVYISFYEISEKEYKKTPYSEKMGRSISNGWNGVAAFFLGFLSLWPLWLAIGLVIWILKRYLKRRKKRKREKK